MYEQFQNIMKMGPFGQIMVNTRPHDMSHDLGFSHMTSALNVCLSLVHSGDDSWLWDRLHE